MRLYTFEKLEVWKLSRKLAVRIYRITGNYPQTEKFGLTRESRRSAVSVPSNIAEGTSRRSYREKSRYIEIAYGSLMELLNQLIMAVDLHFLDEQVYLKIRPDIEELSNKLNALERSYSTK
jgi:four helix bundle protein